jgi:hypothetical protein
MFTVVVQVYRYSTVVQDTHSDTRGICVQGYRNSTGIHECRCSTGVQECRSSTGVLVCMSKQGYRGAGIVYGFESRIGVQKQYSGTGVVQVYKIVR